MKKIKLIILSFLLLVCNTYAQDSVQGKGSRHSIWAGASKDYAFFVYENSNTLSEVGYRRIHFYAATNRNPNYSIYINYGYRLHNWLHLSFGLSFSNQHYYVARYYEPVQIHDSIRIMDIYDYRIKYFSLPIGLKVSFANRFFIRPFILLEICNSVSLSERLRKMILIDVYNSYYSYKWHYYNLRPQLTLGLEGFFLKHYFVGFDITYRTRPWIHPDYGMIKQCWYSNMNFGGHIGYAF